MSSTECRVTPRDGTLKVDVSVRPREESRKAVGVPLEQEHVKNCYDPVWKTLSKIPIYTVIKSEFDRSRDFLAHSIMELKHRVKTQMDAISNEERYASPIKGFEPVHIMIEGLGGSGKSVFTNLLVELCNSLGAFAFLRPAIEKFGDDIAEAQRTCESVNSPFMLLVMDDLYIKKDDPVDAQTIMTIVNSAATPLIIRRTELSGTVVKPLIVISTTNNPYPRSLIDPGALSRRVHRRILMRNGIMFCKDKGGRTPITQVELFNWIVDQVALRVSRALSTTHEINAYAHRIQTTTVANRRKAAAASAKLCKLKAVEQREKIPEINPILVGGLNILQALLD